MAEAGDEDFPDLDLSPCTLCGDILPSQAANPVVWTSLKVGVGIEEALQLHVKEACPGRQPKQVKLEPPDS